MKKQKKSPLKDKPLRTPGQSLDDEIQRVMGEGVLSYLVFPVMVIGFTAWSWLLWYQIILIHNPTLMTIIAIAISVYCFFKMLKVRKRIRALRLGRDGEKAVGQTLDSLRKKGYRDGNLMRRHRLLVVCGVF